MINKLVDKIKKQNAPVVVGLDPMMKFIPEHLKKAAFAEYGETLEGAAEAIWQFNKAIVDNIYDIVPAVKPQVAMYEQFGIEGQHGVSPIENPSIIKKSRRDIARMLTILRQKNPKC